ncbi:hypothetical protein ACWKWC_01600 [Geodermatophilus nigrescens]
MTPSQQFEHDACFAIDLGATVTPSFNDKGVRVYRVNWPNGVSAYLHEAKQSNGVLRVNTGGGDIQTKAYAAISKLSDASIRSGSTDAVSLPLGDAAQHAMQVLRDLP